MVKEIEIKLRATADILQAIRQCPVIERYRCQDWQERKLGNRYFDTADFALASARVALRIRKDGEQLIQTLKSRGSSVAGLSERNEWDWIIARPQLELEKLTDDCWPQELQELDKQQLECIFHTDFTRQLVELCWQYQGEETRAELALDLGEVRTADGRSEEICEVELELRQGQPQALLELALELAGMHPLMPCDISKAERGYRLLQSDSYALQLPVEKLAAEMEMDAAIACLAWQLLSKSQRLAEQYRYSGHWKLLQQWINSLQEFRSLLGGAGQIIPRKSSHLLRLQLEELLSDWLVYAHAGADEALRQQARRMFAVEMEQARWGCFSLTMALWLYRQNWRTERHARAQRQAGAPLGRWVGRFLREELQHLRQSGYIDQPQRLPEQQQRLERIVFWLEHARHLLEAGPLDELLGCLRNLLQAIHREDEDGLRQYSLGLWQNESCRQLIKG